MTPKPYVYTKNTIKIKPLHQFIATLDVKHNNAVCRFGADKAKRKATKKINILWSNIAKLRDHTKINQKFIEALYHCILYHPQVVQSPI